MKLSVNIDHIATLRNARGEGEPRPEWGAVLSELYGAHGITLHLRGDRRHVNEKDLENIQKLSRLKLTLEMAATPQMVEIALKFLPDQVTLVPEKEGEITTEGGLHLHSDLKPIIATLKKGGMLVSLFVDPVPERICLSKELGADIVEIHTGPYAKAFPLGEFHSQFINEFNRLGDSIQAACRIGLRVHAGHGLSVFNLPPLLPFRDLEELSIGHSIVSRALFIGWEKSIKEILNLIQ